MVSSQIRAKARESLTGKWGKAAILMLVFTLITFVINLVGQFIPFIGSIAVAIISTPLSFGLLVSFFKLKNGEDVGYADFLETGFSSFGKVWNVVFSTISKMIGPVILVVASTILMSLSIASESVIFMIIATIAFWTSLVYSMIKGLLYSLTYYILADNPNMSSKEIVAKSELLMKGNRWKLVWLQLSFIGWMILASFTFGIGMLWLTPYMMISMLHFYEDLAENQTSN